MRQSPSRDGSPAALASALGWPALALFAAILAFSFQGSRGIWEPDEGFYVNASLGMIRTGDWLVPHLNGLAFLDKPPLHYWGMAAGMLVLGINEWGARMANALLFMGAVLLIGALGRSLYDRATGRLAALLYATTLLPFFAANILTPDTLLAFWAASAMLCYARASPGEFEHPVPSPSPAARGDDLSGIKWGAGPWWLGLGATAGLGILAKGPAMLVFLAPAVVHFVHRRGWRGALRSPWGYAAVLVALTIGGSWYLLVGLELPGAGAYLLDNQAIGRLATSTYRRNAGLGGGLKVYLPALTIGALPWSAFWPLILWRRRAEGGLAFWRGLSRRPADLLLTLWILVPFAVLLAARSRLVLYTLPLFAPLALATARGLILVPKRGARRARPWILPAAMAAWCLTLIAAKGLAAALPSEKDTRAIARALDGRHVSRDIRIAVVDRKRNGLPFYGYSNFAWVTITRDTYPFFTPVPTLDEELRSGGGSGRGGIGGGGEGGPEGGVRATRALLVPSSSSTRVAAIMAEAGYLCRNLDPIEDLAVILCDPAARDR